MVDPLDQFTEAALELELEFAAANTLATDPSAPINADWLELEPSDPADLLAYRAAQARQAWAKSHRTNSNRSRVSGCLPRLSFG